MREHFPHLPTTQAIKAGQPLFAGDVGRRVGLRLTPTDSRPVQVFGQAFGKFGFD
jgi:hypothetical protein